jgi:hypothetical protein
MLTVFHEAADMNFHFLCQLIENCRTSTRERDGGVAGCRGTTAKDTDIPTWKNRHGRHAA